jgi:hypothetical protein
MQLILRQPAARDSGDESTGVVVAASPDTFGREQWQWDVRLAESADGYAVTVSHNADLINVVEETLQLSGGFSAGRNVNELWLAVVCRDPIVHGTFRLEPGDVAIWEGDDPDMIAIHPLTGYSTIRLIRISRRDGKAARWVP